MSDWYRTPAASLDDAAGAAAAERQARLTKPSGALGRLEDVVLRLAAMQGRAQPFVERVRICVFAADHGVAADGVSAFPQEVTAQMVANMASGGAAISVLAERIGAAIELIDLGTVAPVPPHPGIRRAAIAPSTAHLAHSPAMTATQLRVALDEGHAAVDRALEAGTDLFIGGEMGIGNTTSATALACALLHQPAAALAGPGTGLDLAGIARKQAIIERGLALHREHLADPFEALMHVGGFEIAALTASYCACAQQQLPALVDGFISSVAALTATRLCAGAADWMLLAHGSAEPGHRLIVDALGQRPLLDLGMRLGEGSGAAVAVPLLRLACDLHRHMATFDEAGVADG
ncbi:MAG: nicotinate-nucleotide--dimethylbenzimidazole phosphoribosyltransferase [Thiohalocapsa sp.]